MGSPVELTEMTELDPEELHLVKNGANGFSPLLAKAVKEEVEAAKSDSKEADDIERLLTGSAAKSLCGDLNCAVCAPTLAKMAEEVFPAHPEGMEAIKARLNTASRNALPDSAFVFPKQRKYPIHDESHARNALSRVAGKGSKEKKVRGAVARRFPEIAQAEKSPGNPASATHVPPTAIGLPYWPANRHNHNPKGNEGVNVGAVSPSAGHGSTAPGPVGSGAALGTIPVEQRAIHPASSLPGEVNGRPSAVKMYTYSALAEFLERAEAQREGRAIKEPWVSGPDAAPAADLTEVATELLKSVGGEPKDAIDRALSVAAHIAFAEGSEASMTKAVSQLSAFSAHALSTARDQISGFMAAQPSTVTEADEIMITLTKEELDAKINEGAKKAAKDSFKKERKQLKKAAKKIRQALKNANNHGEVTAEHMQAQVRAKRSADDVAIPGSGVTKGSDTVAETTTVVATPAASPEKVKKDKGSLKKQLKEIQEMVSKMANRPVVGGPHLTGTPAPGAAAPAVEGRQGEVAKSAEDAKIEELQKELAELMKSRDPNAPNRIQAVSYTLSRMQLAQGHRRGEI